MCCRNYEGILEKSDLYAIYHQCILPFFVAYHAIDPCFLGNDSLNFDVVKFFKSKKIKNIELEVDARNNLGIDFWKNNNFFAYRLKMRRDL